MLSRLSTYAVPIRPRIIENDISVVFVETITHLGQVAFSFLALHPVNIKFPVFKGRMVSVGREVNLIPWRKLPVAVYRIDSGG